MKKKILFLALFTLVGLLAFQITFTNIVGANQQFTLFEFIAPIGGLIIGPVIGAASAFIVRLIHVFTDNQALDWVTIARFLPMMMAAVYFGTKTKKNVIIPLLCMVLFIAHPQGRSAWFYSLYWLIPVLAELKKDRLIMRSLGATFTAHAIGSVIFLYGFGLPAAVWIGLIPIVALERGLFTVGIWASYLVFNNGLVILTHKVKLPIVKKLINPRYLISKNFFKYSS
ncbi:hypothetical protein KKI23_00655 [Patescibacteria group bacterium]|nr:hypothetical protein [Patescibacteria group bacterium]